ncbi:hypothetical protein A0H81_03481 [Grifola frondosa]|uniref:Uncharacterized protein n=1 Tax=Grifola frondosa TaxID=5627 RepID=A0A1C7MJI1_GRIFR|nr:hypothetical protein A0H81_03481 [Grifola frondosa]
MVFVVGKVFVRHMLWNVVVVMFAAVDASHIFIHLVVVVVVFTAGDTSSIFVHLFSVFRTIAVQIVRFDEDALTFYVVVLPEGLGIRARIT